MRFSPDRLRQFCTDLFGVLNVEQEDAFMAADALVQADTRGVFSHGCMRMPQYLRSLKSGGVRPDSRLAVVAESPAFALLDAGAGLGIPASVRAMRMAMEKAQTVGAAFVNVRNSHHHGACGYYSMMCAKEGLAGMAMSTGDIIMAVTGSRGKAIGNNPFSYALPAGRFGVICYDVAMSVVASGKLVVLAEEGERVPFGWLLDTQGNPTDDPAEHLRGGALLPFGGYKGYGLSVMVECFAGLLSGAAMLGDIHAWNRDPQRSGNVGHCFIAVDPNIVNPGLDLPLRAEELIEKLIASERAPGVDRIYFPGEIENEKEADAYKNGVALPTASVKALSAAASAASVLYNEEKLLYKR